MNDIESTLTESYLCHAGKVSAVEGDVADVYRRATRRKRKRRALTAVASVALIGAGVAGIAAVQGRDTSPAAATPGMTDDVWYVCDHQLDDGTWQGCVLETPYDNPAWECSDSRTDDLADPDGRVRFAACQPVGEAFPTPGQCVPVTVVAPTAPALPSAPTDMDTVPPAATLAESCLPAVSTFDTVPPYSAVPCGTAPATEAPTVATSPQPCSAPTTPECSLIPIASDASGHVDYGCVSSGSMVGASETTAPGGPIGIPTTTTTLPAERQELIAIGDSIMLSAADTLRQRGYYVDAAVARQMQDVVPVLEQLGEQGVLGDVVVVHLGAHGAISGETLDELLAALADVPNVILINSRIDRPWATENNALLAEADERANVIVIDWAAKGGDCPGECFASDDTHLTSAGAEYYADLIKDVVGI